jgi:chemotaxis response regulator CheB
MTLYETKTAIEQAAIKKVLIIQNTNLLGFVVENLLTSSQAFVVGSLVFRPSMDLAREVQAFEPDVIILDECMMENYMGDFIKLMLLCPHLRIITLDANENVMHTYRRDKNLIHNPADLLYHI